MENVILIVHLILALSLIIVVLLQRSEGGGLGIGGGGGGAMSSRGTATALSKATWLLAIAFIATSITLTVISTRENARDSVIDRLGVEQPVGGGDAPLLPPGLSGDNLLPPTTGDAPALPPAAD
ncbi:preprotein translocase subunit SecG [Rubricella aquisinus]|uniref:Protein-export membrane protein SecG n=1 Tax=Rubricella aquisinus TaxID=2028108 RepID=A0A840X569_9RHOB|nr:preprotein translocase subunit SecG [Rubricella aquisinus]MBB5515847.1 preprotein translocase subunit SecG [Rubricella aquisinus]